jgi:hypothetical protein
MTTNDAAERLPSAARLFQLWAYDDRPLTRQEKADLLDAALAAERRATVERIRAAALHSRFEYGPVSLPQFLAILDTEAER